MSRTCLNTVSFGTTNLISKPTSFSESVGLGQTGITRRCASTEPTLARTTTTVRVDLNNIVKQPNVTVDRAARFHATFAAPRLMRNTLPPLRSNELLGVD